MRALRKLWFSFGHIAKTVAKSNSHKGKVGRRPTERGARSLDSWLRYIPGIVSDTATWEDHFRTLRKIVGRYGREQMLGFDWDRIELNDLMEYANDIADMIRAENSQFPGDRGEIG